MNSACLVLKHTREFSESFRYFESFKHFKFYKYTSRFREYVNCMFWERFGTEEINSLLLLIRLIKKDCCRFIKIT